MGRRLPVRVYCEAMTDMVTKILLVMAGGSLGAAGRYLVSLGAIRLFGTGLNWGTFAANMIGCFMIGVIFALVDRLPLLTPSVRLFFMTGFLGALTTFSTYALEVVASIRSGGFAVAAFICLIHNIGGIGLAKGYWRDEEKTARSFLNGFTLLGAVPL